MWAVVDHFARISTIRDEAVTKDSSTIFGQNFKIYEEFRDEVRYGVRWDGIKIRQAL
jgi:hypothetical protein